ncbi:LytR/AlgR family response regulator transcription factor [Alloscardovia omnicolens]|uniref:LytR/AlgR family response regulator transcription factor n=1 Tax=Alloscardovia omnicolens TaxID=419015 RepID=UPI003A69FF81
MCIAIIDDQDNEAERTRTLLEDYCAQHGLPCTITRYTNGEDFLQFILENQHTANTPASTIPDLIFMDIEMPGLNGMDTARKIREAGNTSVLIFTTRLAQFATHGYEVDAIGYLLKPLDPYSFAMRLKKAVSLINAESATAVHNTISLNYRGNLSQIHAEDIIFVEVKGHYCIYQTVRGSFEVKESLTSAMEKLSSYNTFFLCSRFYVINLARVTTITDNMISLSGTPKTVKVSRLKKTELLERLGAL